MLARGQFAAAAVFIVLASAGDALDGVVARVGGMASPRGAIFDAASDRYQEMAILAGLAIHLHADVASLALVLGAMVASFMVSYGSAKAEAMRVRVPAGSMRRFERSVCLCAGVALVPVARALVESGHAAPWMAEAPILVALAIVAVMGNVSAVLRLRVIATSSHVGAPRREASAASHAVRAP